MKVAIVTGALGGIGSASVKALCKAGFSVVGMDVAPTYSADEFEGFDFSYLKGDLTDPDSRALLLKTAKAGIF